MDELFYRRYDEPTWHARLRLQEEVLRINGPDSFREHIKPTLGVVIERFKTEERFEEIMKQPPGEVQITDELSYSTVAGYRSYLKKHIEPRWASVILSDMKPLEAVEWLKNLSLVVKTKGQIRALIHLLFGKAMLWELIDVQRNPVQLVKLKDASRRKRRPQVIAPEKVQELVTVLHEALPHDGNRGDLHGSSGLRSPCLALATLQLQGRHDARPAVRLAPQVGLESTVQRIFNDIERNGRRIRPY